MFPILAYFWIRMTNPEKTSPTYWSFRFLFVILILIGFGIGAYSLVLKNSLPLTPSVRGDSTSQSDVNSGPTAVPQITPGTGNTDIIIPKIKVIGTKDIDIHETSDDNSRIVGTMIVGQAYLYTDEQSGWYKVMLASSTFGWVDGTFVQVVK